jgi:cytochrome P450
VRDEVMTLFLAGHETTAIAVSWALYLLSQNTACEAKLAKEIEGVVGSRAPTLEDVPRLTYCGHVVSETMRLYPPAWNVGREAKVPFEAQGFRLPAGAQVWMSTYVVQRDPRWFDAPDSFRPERWEDGLAKRIPKFAYFPFGGGPRLCIGNAFATMEAVLILATILQRFRLSLDGSRPVKTFPAITLRPKHGLWMRVAAR